MKILHLINKPTPDSIHAKGLTKVKDETIISRLMKDRTGWYLRPDNTTHHIVRPESEDGTFDIVGEVLAVQRIVE